MTTQKIFDLGLAGQTRTTRPSLARTFFQAQRKECVLTQQDYANLNQYLDSRGVILMHNNLDDLRQYKYIVCIPTILLSSTDDYRHEAIIVNIEIHLDAGAKVILFYRQVQHTDIVTYFNERFFSIYGQPVGYMIYNHPGQSSHVGWARMAIAKFLTTLDRNLIVDINDDRRYLGLKKELKNSILTTEKINQHIEKILEKIRTDESYKIIVCPAGQRTDSKKAAFVQYTKKTFINAQIYFAKAGTFVDVYACGLKHQDVCKISTVGLRSTPSLNACFARLFEDYSFINIAFDNKFNVITFTGLKRFTKRIHSVARKSKNPQTMTEQQRKHLEQAMDGCVVFLQDDPRDANKVIALIRCGAHMDTLRNKAEKDGYEFHLKCLEWRYGKCVDWQQQQMQQEQRQLQQQQEQRQLQQQQQHQQQQQQQNSAARVPSLKKSTTMQVETIKNGTSVTFTDGRFGYFRGYDDNGYIVQIPTVGTQYVRFDAPVNGTIIKWGKSYPIVKGSL